VSGTEPAPQGMSRADSESNAQEIGVQVDRRTRWLIAFAVMASAVMELVDTSAVNVSLPTLQAISRPPSMKPPGY